MYILDFHDRINFINKKREKLNEIALKYGSNFV